MKETNEYKEALKNVFDFLKNEDLKDFLKIKRLKDSIFEEVTGFELDADFDTCRFIIKITFNKDWLSYNLNQPLAKTCFQLQDLCFKIHKLMGEDKLIAIYIRVEDFDFSINQHLYAYRIDSACVDITSPCNFEGAIRSLLNGHLLNFTYRMKNLRKLEAKLNNEKELRFLL